MKQLGATATGFARRKLRARRVCRESALLNDLLSHTRSFHWNSRYFTKSGPLTPERAENAVDTVFYDKSAQREVSRQIQKLGGISAAAFWDTYLRRSSLAVEALSDGWLDMVQLTDSALPEVGGIVDWTCHSGAMATGLALASIHRRILAVDSNPRAVIATRRVFKRYLPEHDFKAKHTSPDAPGLVVAHGEGAVVKDALFLLEGKRARALWLAAVSRHLAIGGHLVLIEPKAGLYKQSQLRLWILRTVKSACLNSPALTEFDIALYCEIQRRLFEAAAHRPNTTADLVQIARYAGFETELVRDTFYGQYTALILRKVTEPPELEDASAETSKKKSEPTEPQAPARPKVEPVIRHHSDPLPKSHS